MIVKKSSETALSIIFNYRQESLSSKHCVPVEDCCKNETSLYFAV